MLHVMLLDDKGGLMRQTWKHYPEGLFMD